MKILEGRSASIIEGRSGCWHPACHTWVPTSFVGGAVRGVARLVRTKGIVYKLKKYGSMPCERHVQEPYSFFCKAVIRCNNMLQGGNAMPGINTVRIGNAMPGGNALHQCESATRCQAATQCQATMRCQAAMRYINALQGSYTMSYSHAVRNRQRRMP
jgi:hypothetical protein